MPPRRRIDPVAGHDAVQVCRAAGFPSRPTGAVSREILALAVRFTLEALAARERGRSVEVRVPPYGAVQCIPGPTHTRGTPPNVIETDPGTWLALSVGDLAWGRALAEGRVRASGLRAHLDTLLPFVAPRPGPD